MVINCLSSTFGLPYILSHDHAYIPWATLRPFALIRPAYNPPAKATPHLSEFHFVLLGGRSSTQWFRTVFTCSYAKSSHSVIFLYVTLT